MKMKAQLALAITVVTLVIGFVIADDLISGATNLNGVTDEQHTITSVPEVYTLDNPRLSESTLTIENATGDVNLTKGINYTVLSYDNSKINITDYDRATHGGTLNNTYSYEPQAYYHSSLSRTVVNYVVPLGLLGVLAFIATRTL